VGGAVELAGPVYCVGAAGMRVRVRAISTPPISTPPRPPCPPVNEYGWDVSDENFKSQALVSALQGFASAQYRCFVRPGSSIRVSSVYCAADWLVCGCVVSVGVCGCVVCVDVCGVCGMWCVWYTWVCGCLCARILHAHAPLEGRAMVCLPCVRSYVTFSTYLALTDLPGTPDGQDGWGLCNQDSATETITPRASYSAFQAFLK
jgi:hypothetical protein